MFPLYTKTFGGKIWKNLHSVSPDNFLSAKFNMASFTISRQNSFKHHLVQKKLKAKRQVTRYFKKSIFEPSKSFLELVCTRWTLDKNLFQPIFVATQDKNNL